MTSSSIAPSLPPPATPSSRRSSRWSSGLFYELRRGTANRARDLRPIADIHHKIYKAIREHAPAKAASLMNEHLLAAEQQQDFEDQSQDRKRY